MAYEASEIMTAAALMYKKSELDDYISQGKIGIINLIHDSREKIESGKSSVFFGNNTIKDGFVSLMVEKNAADMVVGISAAYGIRDFMNIGMNKIPKVYMTGNVWPKDVEIFKVSAYGFPDYNSSDILVTTDNKSYYGISLKKKKSVTAGDPTLINKAFDTVLADPSNAEFKKIKDSLTKVRTDYFSSLVMEAIESDLINWRHINNSSGQKFKTKREFDSWAGTAAGKKELFTGSKRDKSLFSVKNYINLKGSAHPKFLKTHKQGYNWDPDKGALKSYSGPSMRNFVNSKLAEPNNPLWKKFIGVMNNNAEVFADALINVILKKYLYKEVDAQTLKKYKFHFALVTGIGDISKDTARVQESKVIPLKTTLCGLTRIEEQFKNKPYEIVIDTSKKEDSDAAKIFFKLKRGKVDILDLELRYKGDFNPQPQFQGGISKQFKNLLTDECDF